MTEAQGRVRRTSRSIKKVRMKKRGLRHRYSATSKTASRSIGSAARPQLRPARPRKQSTNPQCHRRAITRSIQSVIDESRANDSRRVPSESRLLSVAQAIASTTNWQRSRTRSEVQIQPRRAALRVSAARSRRFPPALERRAPLHPHANRWTAARYDPRSDSIPIALHQRSYQTWDVR